MNVKLGIIYNTMEICQACLRTGDCIYPMSVEDLKRYRLFITKVEDPLVIMYICIYCKSILRRIVKFIEQCRLSDVFIKETLSKDPEVLSKIRVDHLGTSKTKYSYVGPNNDLDLKVEGNLKNEATGDEDVIPLVLLNHSNVEEDCNDYDEESSPGVLLKAKSGRCVKSKRSNVYVKHNNDLNLKLEGNFKNEASDDEDEIPLVLLNHSNGDGKCDYYDESSDVFPKLRMEHLSTSKTTCYYIGPNNDVDSNAEDTIKDEESDAEDDIPLVLLNHSNDEDFNDYGEPSDESNKKMEVEREGFEDLEDIVPNGGTKKTKKKQVKEGFTSRMVTETNEYVVIKLTKEQILEDMKEHSKSEKYKILPYKCEKCVRGFNFEDVLHSHMGKHSPSNGPFQCEICEQYCPSKVSLRGHMKSHSTRYKCKLCDLIRLSRQHILEHYSLEHTDSAALYRCPKCPHTTNKRTVMQRHVRLHSTSEPLKCKLCGKFYKSKESLRVHVMRHDGKKLHQCELCTSSFVYATQLTKHMLSVHERKDYYCVECDIMFKSMDNLKQHLKRAKRHRDSSSYKHQCPHCEQRFISASTLATHRSAAHGADKPARCAQCARRYSSADALRGHRRRAHAPPHAALPCPLCDRVFSRKYVLRVHMRTHTGERPHTCPCGAAFAQASALRAHCAAKHKK